MPSAPAIELFGRVKLDPDAAHRIAYAASETASFIAMMRKAHPEARLGDIEPYPALNPDEIETAIHAIQKVRTELGVRGPDFFRLDVDWDLMEQKDFGSWAEVNQIAALCRARGIAFSMIFWAANQPRLVRCRQFAWMVIRRFSRCRTKCSRNWALTPFCPKNGLSASCIGDRRAVRMLNSIRFGRKSPG